MANPFRPSQMHSFCLHALICVMLVLNAGSETTGEQVYYTTSAPEPRTPAPAAPTSEPTAVPTAAPTSAPTAVPTAAPTSAPTAVTTSVPTAGHTAAPTSAEPMRPAPGEPVNSTASAPEPMTPAPAQRPPQPSGSEPMRPAPGEPGNSTASVPEPAEEEEPEEEEEVEASKSPVAVAVALTLFASISFMMLLMYLVNHSDDDIRRYTYQTLNMTVSIFCAVLLFQSCNDVVKLTFASMHLKENMLLLQAGVVMTLWFIILQFLLAYLLNIIGGDYSTADLDADGTRRVKVQHFQFLEWKKDAKCFVVLFAHLAGFAAVNFWAQVQAQAMKQYDLPPFSIVVVALFGMKILMAWGSCFRSRVSEGAGTDVFEREWDKATVDSEDDVVALALSFVATQATRKFITSKLPNDEGKEDDGILFGVTYHQISQLIGAAFAYLFLAVGLFWLKGFITRKQNERREAQKSAPEPEEPESGGWFTMFSPRGGEEEEEEEDSDEEEEEEPGEGLMRTITLISDSAAMAFAWCIFYGSKWFIAYYKLGDHPDEHGNSTHDRTILGVIVALFLSFMGFASIFRLDKIADRMKESGKGAEGMRLVKLIIRSVGLVVGFAWEQSFDEAVGTLAAVSGRPEVTKLCLAFFCGGLLIPAWRWYLLPMVEEKGWKYGFVVHQHWNEEHYERAKAKLKKVEDERKEGINPKYRLLSAGEGTYRHAAKAMFLPFRCKRPAPKTDDGYRKL